MVNCTPISARRSCSQTISKGSGRHRLIFDFRDGLGVLHLSMAKDERIPEKDAEACSRVMGSGALMQTGLFKRAL